jgi:hypothetical protein
MTQPIRVIGNREVKIARESGKCTGIGGEDAKLSGIWGQSKVEKIAR